MDKLPQNWSKVKFGDVVKRVKDQVPNRDEWDFDRYIGGEHFEEGEIRVTKSAPIEGNEEVIGSAFRMRFKPGHVLYVSRNPRLRKGGMVDFEGVCSDVTYVMQADETKLLQSLLPFVIQTEDFVRHTTNHAHGSTNPFLNWKDIKKYEFFLPEIEYQQHINDVLWSIQKNFEKTSTIQIKLDKIWKKYLNQELLKGTNTKKYFIEIAENFPKGWSFRKLEEHLERVTYGFTNPMPHTEEGPYIITAANIINGQIDFKNCWHTSEKAYNELLTPKSRPKINDLLLTKDGTLGRIAILKKNKCCINQSVALLRCNESLLPRYLYFLLQTDYYQKRMIGDAGGTTIKHIYITKVDKMKVPVPPIEIQKKMIEKINYVVIARKAIEKQNSDLRKLRNKLTDELISGKIVLKKGTKNV